MKQPLALLALFGVAYLLPCLMSLNPVYTEQRLTIPVNENLCPGSTLPVLSLGVMVLLSRRGLPTVAPLLAAFCMGLLLDGLSESNRIGLHTMSCTLLAACLIWWHSRPLDPPWKWLVSLPLATMIHSMSGFMTSRLPAGWMMQLLAEVGMVTMLVVAGTIFMRLPQIWFAPTPPGVLSISNRWSRLTPD